IAALGKLRLVARARGVGGFEEEAGSLFACIAASQVARHDRCRQPFAERRAPQVLAQLAMHTYPAPPIPRAVGDVTRERVTPVGELALLFAQAARAKSHHGVFALRPF